MKGIIEGKQAVDSFYWFFNKKRGRSMKNILNDLNNFLFAQLERLDNEVMYAEFNHYHKNEK